MNSSAQIRIHLKIYVFHWLQSHSFYETIHPNKKTSRENSILSISFYYPFHYDPICLCILLFHLQTKQQQTFIHAKTETRKNEPCIQFFFYLHLQ